MRITTSTNWEPANLRKLSELAEKGNSTKIGSFINSLLQKRSQKWSRWRLLKISKIRAISFTWDTVHSETTRKTFRSPRQTSFPRKRASSRWRNRRPRCQSHLRGLWLCMKMLLKNSRLRNWWNLRDRVRESSNNLTRDPNRALTRILADNYSAKDCSSKKKRKRGLALLGRVQRLLILRSLITQNRLPFSWRTLSSTEWRRMCRMNLMQSWTSS